MGIVRDVVVRVLLRRRPATPLPPKNQLPLSDHVYCYGPLGPDDPDSPSGWHWAPRKDYFDRSAEATLEYYAPMSSSASVNELPRSRCSSVSAGRPGSRASGAARDTSGASALDAGELADRLKQYQKDEMLSPAADMLLSGAVGCEDATSGFCSPPVPPAGLPNGLIAFAVNIPYPSAYHSPVILASPPRKTPLKSILKTPRTPAPVPLPVSPPSPVLLTPVYPQPVRSPPSPLQMPPSLPQLVPLVPSPPLPFIPPGPSPHFARPGPASLVSSSQSSPAVEHPIIPPFPSYAPEPFPSPPHAIRSPPAPASFFARPAHPAPFPPSLPLEIPANAPSPPFQLPAHAPSPPFQFPFPSPAHALSPPPLFPHPAHAPSPPPPPPPRPSFPAYPPAPSPPRHYPPGYAAGISSLLSAPGELRFSFRSSPPHALLRRRLNPDPSRRVAVPLSDPMLGESAFYPAERDVLLVMPQLPWAVALRSEAGGEGWVSVGDVLSALREHLGSGVRPAEREMLRADVRMRGDALGDRSWLLGVWEHPDAVRRVMGPGQDVQFVRGRRCFVVLFGSEEESMC